MKELRVPNLLDCVFLNSQVFDNFTLADELFAKALRRLKTRSMITNFENWLH